MTSIEFEQLTPLSDLTLSQVIHGVEDRKPVPMIAYVIDPVTGVKVRCFNPVSGMYIIDCGNFSHAANPQSYYFVMCLCLACAFKSNGHIDSCPVNKAWKKAHELYYEEK